MSTWNERMAEMATPEKVVVELSSRLAAELASANQALLTDLLQRGLRALHIEQALARYRQGGMSFAAAAEQAGVSLPELARAAYVRNIEPPFDQDMVAEELQ
jgi:predicted HTH domain antitoxin